jgi:hypothetical protein
MNATLDLPTQAPNHADRDWCTEVPVVDPSRLLDYYEHFTSVRVLRHHLEP